MKKWIITDIVHPVAEEVLRQYGRDVDVRPDIGNEELEGIIAGYEGIIISSRTRIDKQILDKAGSLRIVGRVGSGMEHVDRDYCAQKGISCFSSPEGNCNAVGEHAMGMLLALSKNIGRANRELLEGEWRREQNRGFELKGRTVGIIGYGHTGSAFARKLAGWDVRVLAYDKYKQGYGDSLVEESNLGRLMAESDVISFHIPYNDETHHWINREFMQACGRRPVIINTSRGAIACTEDLVYGLEECLITGLCIDVFEDEPLGKGAVNNVKLYEKIMRFPNVVATPHIAGWSVESAYLLAKILMDKIVMVL